MPNEVGELMQNDSKVGLKTVAQWQLKQLWQDKIKTRKEWRQDEPMQYLQTQLYTLSTSLTNNNFDQTI